MGTKGFTFEGPFFLNAWGKIIGWDEEKEAHAKRLVMVRKLLTNNNFCGNLIIEKQ